MQYQIDHDFHIHSQLSSCSRDPEQTTARILQYAQENRFHTICLTDHFWDETVPGASAWYKKQDYPHIRQSLPLPTAENVRFCFGCETDMDKNCRIGISKAVMDELDFVIIPSTHLHMMGFTIDEADTSIERRRIRFIERIHALLDMDLPFYKIGIAHLNCPLIANIEPQGYIRVLSGISDAEFRDIFTKAAKKGVGIELNYTPMELDAQEVMHAMRPFGIAAECGCKFYLGSDAHHPGRLKSAIPDFAYMIRYLGLTEEQKFSFLPK